MKKVLLVGLYVLGTLAVGAYGFILGSATRTTTYESDMSLCKTACEPNGGTDRMWTDSHCICENGASFTGKDLRP